MLWNTVLSGKTDKLHVTFRSWWYWQWWSNSENQTWWHGNRAHWHRRGITRGVASLTWKKNDINHKQEQSWKESPGVPVTSLLQPPPLVTHPAEINNNHSTSWRRIRYSTVANEAHNTMLVFQLMLYVTSTLEDNYSDVWRILGY